MFVSGCGMREKSLLNVVGTWKWLLFSSKLCYLWGLFVDVVQRVVLCIFFVFCGWFTVLLLLLYLRVDKQIQVHGLVRGARGLRG